MNTTDAINAALDAAAARAPEAAVVVVGPAWVDANPPRWITRLRDTLQGIAEARGLQWVDPIAEGWFAGGDPSLIGADGIHPTDAGQQLIADRMRSVLEPVLTARAGS